MSALCIYIGRWHNSRRLLSRTIALSQTIRCLGSWIRLLDTSVFICDANEQWRYQCESTTRAEENTNDSLNSYIDVVNGSQLKTWYQVASLSLSSLWLCCFVMTCSGGLKDAGQTNKTRTRSGEGESSETKVNILEDWSVSGCTV